jgi:hypothetical protein
MNNLKNILYRLKFASRTLGSADEMGVRPDQFQGIGGWQNDPLMKDLGLWVADKFLQHHGPGSNTPIRLDRLMNDATIIFPDLDNPDVIVEYVRWVKNISTCYKIVGEGNATEVIFGYEGAKYLMCFNGLLIDASCAVLERNEVPIKLPSGTGRSQEVVNLASTSMVLYDSPYKVADFRDKSIAQIRAMICQMDFNLPWEAFGKPWDQASEEEKQDARYRFVQDWLNNVVTHIESEFTGFKLKNMGYYNAPGYTSQNIVGQTLELGENLCKAVTQVIVAEWVNLAANIVNTFEEFQFRRVRQLLRMQALMYFTLLLNPNVCDELSGEERDKCRCGIKKKPVPPPEPEPEVDTIFSPIITGPDLFMPHAK